MTVKLVWIVAFCLLSSSGWLALGRVQHHNLAGGRWFSATLATSGTLTHVSWYHHNYEIGRTIYFGFVMDALCNIHLSLFL